MTDLASTKIPLSQSQSHGEFQKIPTKLYIGNLPSSKDIEKKKKMRSKTIDTDRKERLQCYSEMLHACASKRSLKDGKAIHGQVIKKGIEPDLHLWVSFVNVYAKSGETLYARKVLDDMPERDVVSWTALIRGFEAEGHDSDAINLFSEMKKDGIIPNEFTLAIGLTACSHDQNLWFGKQLHAEAIKVGFLSDLYVGSNLVGLYAKCGKMELANSAFISMPEKNSVAWNALLSGYAEVDGEKVLKLFRRMAKTGMELGKFTLSVVLKGCTNLGKLREGQTMHSLVIKTGCDFDDFLGCSLVYMYSKCGLAIDALNVFLRIREPDVVTWTAIITCLDLQGQWQEASNLFNLMMCRGVQPNEFSFTTILSSATQLADLRYGESIHGCICKFGHECDVSVGNALITMYTKNGQMQESYQVFEAIKVRDVISWNACLSGFHDLEDSNLGPRIFQQMLLEGFRPNEYTFLSVLRCCSSLLDLGLGKQIHVHAIKNSLEDDDIVGTRLVEMYVENRCLENAELAFRRLTHRDLFAWTVIIIGYKKIGQAEKAVRCLNQMQQEGLKPNEFTFAGCLSACSVMATLENGRQIHSMVFKGGYMSDLFVSSAVVHMYMKCGCMEDAEAIFEGLISRDTTLWNTIIYGYSQHGQGKKALEAYAKMIDRGFLPDDITFVGVFSACSHLGLVEEAKAHYNNLTKVFEINPTIEHHACMVDILGRAGRFNEVECFIKDMKLTPHAVIWENILGACNLHGNVEFGKRAAARLFELKPEMDSTYILLSNIFAAKGMWDDVREVRKLMCSHGVKKEPGCSWVEVDGQIHVFVSQDNSHPKTREIYLKLEELGQKLTSAGYKPAIRNVLHNISEREKEEHLEHHSERLALAFALVSTNYLKPIRIFKNLRICGDCHDFMMLFSNFVNQEIIVRDIKRFHHFKEGTCSCQGLW